MKRFFFFLSVIAMLLFLLFYPKEAFQASADGLRLWFFTVLPTLLPFLILSDALIHAGKIPAFFHHFSRFFSWSLGLSLYGTYAFALGLFCGYPLGARLTADLLKEIQKAIQVSDLGINPQNDGKVIRLVFPQLTEERRKDLAKQVKKYAEDAKVAMRNIRRDGMDYVKKLKKNSEITEDDQKKAEKDLQDLLDKNIKRVDAALAAKEKELMSL